MDMVEHTMKENNQQHTDYWPEIEKPNWLHNYQQKILECNNSLQNLPKYRLQKQSLPCYM